MPEFDWTERSNREAAVMLADVSASGFTTEQYTALVELLAMAYRRGAYDGMTRAQELIGQHSVKS